MIERPILFSAPMVRAILSGAKTQTRRIVKPQPAAECRYEMNGAGDRALHLSGTAPDLVFVPAGPRTADHRLACPYGAPGDRLWVRETWTSAYADGCWGTAFAADRAFVQGARAHKKGPHFQHPKAFVDGLGVEWRPSIHMPRWASRITLEVTSVRCERLSAISEDDARAEGVDEWVPCRVHTGLQGVRLPLGALKKSCREHFEQLWDSINGKRAPWASKPWVWAIGFKRVEVTS